MRINRGAGFPWSLGNRAGTAHHMDCFDKPVLPFPGFITYRVYTSLAWQEDKGTGETAAVVEAPTVRHYIAQAARPGR